MNSGVMLDPIGSPGPVSRQLLQAVDDNDGNPNVIRAIVKIGISKDGYRPIDASCAWKAPLHPTPQHSLSGARKMLV